MKDRKILLHKDLIREVSSLAKTRFDPRIKLIKKCIETLIEKEYLKRTENPTAEYSYVA
jgi:hypothetical protein